MMQIDWHDFMAQEFKRIFEEVLKKTEDAFPGQSFPEPMKPMLYALVKGYHAAIIEYIVQPENKSRLIRQGVNQT